MSLPFSVQVGISGIANGRAMRARSYIPDKLPPFLQHFSLDMDSGDMNITFSEPVDLTTFDASALSIQQKQVSINHY